MIFVVFFFKQETGYEMRISDWSSDVCSSDLLVLLATDLRVVLSGRHEHIRARVHRCGVWHLLVAELRVEPTLRGIVEDADECRIGWRRGRIQAGMRLQCGGAERGRKQDRKSTRLNSSH